MWPPLKRPSITWLKSACDSNTADTAARTVTQSLHTFGGIGLTVEHDIHLYNLRAKAWPLMLGDPQLLLAEAGRMDRLPPMMPELDLVVSGRSLARLGFRYVVLHGDLYPPERRQQSVDILRVALGPETAVRDSMLLWRLESPEKETALAQPDKAP